MKASEQHDPEWAAAREVWSSAGVTLGQKRSTAQEPLLERLKWAVGIYEEVKRIGTTERNRSWRMRDGATIVRNLSEFLASLDDVALSRLRRVSSQDVDETLNILFPMLSVLENAFNNAPQSERVRRRKHQYHAPLVRHLADSFEQHTGRKASVTTEYSDSERGGIFVKFVHAFLNNFLPEEQGQLNGRAIQMILASRSLNPTPIKGKKS